MGLFKKKSPMPVKEPIAQTPENPSETHADLGTDTSLYFHPDWELSASEQYVYRFRHQQLEALKPNQLSITGLNMAELDGDIMVVAFLRNTLPKTVNFEEVDLLLIDKDGKAFAKKQFEMDDIGEMPPMSCMPWRFLFLKEDRVSEEIPEDGWKIAFQLKQPQKEALELDSTWENQISAEQRKYLEEMVTNLPKLNTGEINLMGIEATMKDDGTLACVVLIRNGNDKNIKLETIPLVVEDADGDIVCQGGFTLENFEVKANTSKPWTFIFPAALITKPQPNFERWKVYPPQS
ncbi:accessory Sec system S-layer assembly protein [Actinomycetes bacterium NPDC127524]